MKTSNHTKSPTEHTHIEVTVHLLASRFRWRDVTFALLSRMSRIRKCKHRRHAEEVTWYVWQL